MHVHVATQYAPSPSFAQQTIILKIRGGSAASNTKSAAWHKRYVDWAVFAGDLPPETMPERVAAVDRLLAAFHNPSDLRKT